MFWETLTVDEFAQAREKCGGVCVVPIGCLEKHGNHLPLGTDILSAREVATRAAEQEEVMIFPFLPFGGVCEVKHCLGTVALSMKLLLQMLEELCDELSRNGFKKILFLNGHGGNAPLLNAFIRSRLERPHDYAVYTANYFQLTNEQRAEFEKLNGEPIRIEGHACIYETSTVMAFAPELVKMEALSDNGKPLHRLDEFIDLDIGSSVGWYADYPHQFAGEPEHSTPEKGAYLMECYVERTRKIFRAVKNTDLPDELVREFYEKTADPTA